MTGWEENCDKELYQLPCQGNQCSRHTLKCFVCEVLTVGVDKLCKVTFVDFAHCKHGKMVLSFKLTECMWTNGVKLTSY